MEYIYEECSTLSKNFCHEIIEKFDSDSRRRPGELKSGAIDHTVKKRIDLSIEHITDWDVESKRLNDAFITSFTNYINNLKLNVFGKDKVHILEKIFSGPNVHRTHFLMGRYDVGGHFTWHVDYLHYGERICNFIIYLNDHEACTEFLDGKKIKPEAGKILFFPTTWVHAHCGQSVEKNAKYIITGFICHAKELTQSLPFIVTRE